MGEAPPEIAPLVANEVGFELGRTTSVQENVTESAIAREDQTGARCGNGRARGSP